jgi:hexokinase
MFTSTGTGCNAAYVEKLANIAKWKVDDVSGSAAGDEVVVDTEWGAFGDNGSLDFLKTPFDTVIDLNSNHVGSFT